MDNLPIANANIIWHVTCSCGASTLVRWDAAKGKFVADTPAWRHALEHQGWTCGKYGHYQANAVGKEVNANPK